MHEALKAILYESNLQSSYSTADYQVRSLAFNQVGYIYLDTVLLENSVKSIFCEPTSTDVGA